jgi:enoyl-CoA hydratase/carnithine racemase
MSDRVTVAIDNGVADVRLNRPEKLNALDGAMFNAIAEAGEALKSDRSVRAVVLSGEGRGFCAGLDLTSFQAMAGAESEGGENGEGELDALSSMRGRITHLGQQVSWVWAELEVPVIAAVHGVALGGGLQVALGADIRIVAPDARLSVLEVRWGLTPDMTATWFLPRLVGPDVAKELTWSGRMVSGEEAVRIGLATRVSESPRDDALVLAQEIAGKSPEAIRGSKRLLDASLGRTSAEQFADERSTIGSVVGTPNQVEAVNAYFAKRDPTFADP